MSPKPLQPGKKDLCKVALCQSITKGMLHVTLWVSTAVPLNAPTVCSNSSGVAQRAQRIFEVTSYPQRTSRGLSHAFFVQIKCGPVKQNKRAHRSSQHCGKKESFLLLVEIRVSPCGMFTSSVLPFPFLST